MFDTEPVPDRVAITVLEFVKSTFDVFGQGPDDLPSARVSAIIDEEQVHVETESNIGSGVAALVTTIDAPSTCSTKCLHLAVNTDLVGRYDCDNAGENLITGLLQVYSKFEEAGSLYPLCVLLHTFCSGDGSRGWCKVLFHEDLGSLIPVHGIITSFLVGNQLVILDSVETSGFESKFWDPGQTKCLEFMALTKSPADLTWDLGASDCSKYVRFDVDFGSGAAFLWDPDSLESLQSIGFANFDLAYTHELHVDKFIELTGIGSDFQILLLQQKCGGTADMWVIALGYMCRECQFKTWKFSFLDEIAQVDSFSVSGNVEFLQSGLDYHVPPCAQWQSSICYGCSVVDSHSKTDLIRALLLQWDWHIRALVVVTSKVHMPWGFSWLATPDGSYTVGYNIALEMLVGAIQSVNLGDGPRAHSLLLSEHDHKMADFLELQAQDGIGLPGISFLDQSLSVKVVAGAAADDGLSLQMLQQKQNIHLTL
jgi:hypothetical protein